MQLEAFVLLFPEIGNTCPRVIPSKLARQPVVITADADAASCPSQMWLMVPFAASTHYFPPPIDGGLISWLCKSFVIC